MLRGSGTHLFGMDTQHTAADSNPWGLEPLLDVKELALAAAGQVLLNGASELGAAVAVVCTAVTQATTSEGARHAAADLISTIVHREWLAHAYA